MLCRQTEKVKIRVTHIHDFMIMFTRVATRPTSSLAVWLAGWRTSIAVAYVEAHSFIPQAAALVGIIACPAVGGPSDAPTNAIRGQSRRDRQSGRRHSRVALSMVNRCVQPQLFASVEPSKCSSLCHRGKLASCVCYCMSEMRSRGVCR